MILPILAFGQPLLRQVASPIDKNYPDLTQLISNMYETMYSANGVGLAAPQIGLSIRLIVVDTKPFGNDYPDGKNFKEVIINPIILEYSGNDRTFNEGCLSVPEIREDVIRKEIIVMEYYDQDFNFHSKEFSGICSRVLQHEYDHLEGILFVDKVSPLKKMLIKRTLSDISKGKVEHNYNMIFPFQKKI
jgi:peptide deformylase